MWNVLNRHKMVFKNCSCGSWLVYLIECGHALFSILH
ncbi:TPA: SWIM zinc finger family protein [Proteus mirabilis]